MFSTKTEPSVLMRSLAMHFARRLDFALISSNITELQDEFHITKLPAVVVRRPDGDVQHFEGQLNAIAMSDFLRKFAPERIQDEVNRCASKC